MLLRADGLTLLAELAGGPAQVLRDLSFAVEPGRVLGLVGESGAGKTMVGRIVSGLLPAGFTVAAGRLLFGGTDLLRLPRRAHRALLGDRIAFIPQEPLSALNPALTIGQQFGEHLARLGLGRRARRERAQALLAEVRLAEPATILRRYPFQLSGGMCQRVLIALAFASDPELIIADEPTTALDATTQAHIVVLLRRLIAAHGTGVIFITHDLRLAAHLCDEILVLHAGDVVERGPAKRLLTAPFHPYTRALQRAAPPLAGPRRRLASLPEQMPGLAAYAGMPGCRFAARCPVADPACRARLVPLREIAAGHWARCTPACSTAGAAAEEAIVVPPAAAAAAAAAPILALDGIGKRYGRRRKAVDAVREVGFTIAPGEFLGIVGESGSGKSTLARLIMGLERPSTGSIRLDGAPLGAGAAAWRARIAALQIVFQDPQSALNPRRRVASLVTQALEAGARAASRAERQATALALLREIGLPPEIAGRYPPQLSGGQRQRINIARAIAAAPRLLVADEIVSGLDVSVQAQILALLLRLREEHGIALLFISHDLAVVRWLCSRVLVMHRGLIVEEGTTDNVFAAPRHPYTRALLAALPPDDLDQAWPAEAAADPPLSAP